MNTPSSAADTKNSTESAAADTINKVSDKARNLTEDVLQGAKSAVDATRDAANASMDKVEERVEKWRKDADPAVSDLAAKAQALAESSINYCAEASARMREQMDKYSEHTTRYVTQQPGKSVALAAAAGAVLTLATLALMRRRDD